MSNETIPVAIQMVLEAAHRLEDALSSVARPDLETPVASGEDVRERLTTALRWLSEIKTHYGDPIRGDTGPETPPSMFEGERHPKSILAYFLPEWRGGTHVDFIDLTTVLGSVPEEIADSGADALQKHLFGSELGFRETHARRPYKTEHWPGYQSAISLYINACANRSARLIQWIRSSAERQALTFLPIIRYVREARRNRVVVAVDCHGLTNEKEIPNEQRLILTTWSKGEPAETNRRAWGTLRKTLPQIVPLVTRVPSARGGENDIALRMHPDMPNRIQVEPPR